MPVDSLVARLMPYVTLDDILTDYKEGRLELSLEEYAYFCMEYYDRTKARQESLVSRSDTLIESPRPD